MTNRRQTIEIEVELPTSNSRMDWRTKSRLTAKQRAVTRRGLESMAYRPTLPIDVTLIRVSRGTADNVRAASSLEAVRDELARWAHGIPAYVIGKGGKPRVPRAPDGAKDGIVWRYRQEKTKKVGYNAAKITIQEVGDV